LTSRKNAGGFLSVSQNALSGSPAAPALWVEGCRSSGFRFSLPHLLPWPPMEGHASLKEAHKNASSPQTNPDIKGRNEREPKSPNQRH